MWVRAALAFALAATLAVVPLAAQGDGLDWLYVALGDSLGTGYNAERGYARRYAARLEADTDAEVELINLSRNGFRSADLLQRLESDRYRAPVGHAQVVTWNIGGNDLQFARYDYQRGRCGGPDNQDCLRAALGELKSNWGQIVAAVLDARALSHTIVRTMDLYNPFVAADRVRNSWPDDACDDLNADGRCSDFEVFKPYFDEVNAFFAESAAAHGIPLARVSRAFNGPDGMQDPADLIGPDGIHPSEAGHARIAESLAALDYAPLWPEAPDQALDGDGDGVPDEHDLCPEFPGAPETDGC